MTERINPILIFLFILTLPVNVKSQQPISDFSIADSISYPLLAHDAGIKFKYVVNRAGDVSHFLQSRGRTYTFPRHRLTRGEKELRISSTRLSEFYTSVGSHSSSLRISHIDALNNSYSEKYIPLEFLVIAPYGADLFPNPTRPPHLSTRNIKKVPNPLGYIGIAISVAAIAAGIAQEIEEKDTGSTLIGIGFGIGAVSLTSTTKRVPDDDLNRQNQLINDRRMRTYSLQVNEINEKNQLIRETYQIKVRINI